MSGAVAEKFDTPIEPMRVEYAKSLQRRGWTFSEIARHMRVSRESVVDALYWGEGNELRDGSA